MARNGSAVANAGQFPDWVELYNTSATPQSLAGFGLTDKLTNPTKFVFGAGITLEPGGYLVVWCDSNTNAPGLHTLFNLDAGGLTVALFASASATPVLLDSVTFGPQARDLSIGRVPDGTGPWELNRPTPGAANQSQAVGSGAGLRINEWMDNPPKSSDWFELYNSAELPVMLSGLYLSGTLTNPANTKIPPLSFIAARGYAQFLADDKTNGANHVNFKISANGDSIGLFNDNLQPIDTVTFGPLAAGVSQGRFPDGSATIVDFPYSPSPGEPNFTVPSIVINEALSHTGIQDFPPTEDAIELYNPMSSTVDLSGWFLSDSEQEYWKYRIADGTVMAPGTFRVFYEYQFNSKPGATNNFALSSHGDAVYLTGAATNGLLTGFRTNVVFGAQHHGVSFGRYYTSVGVEFVAQVHRTLGADQATTIQEFRTGTGLPNAGPKVGPVVINEIMYHPPSLTNGMDNTLDEYIELYNFSSNAVPLYDPLALTNTWHLSNAVSYVFPRNVVLPARSPLLLVSFDPGNPVTVAAFRTKYSVPPGVPIFGPYGGKLKNTGDVIELYEPDQPDPDLIPYVLVEQIAYQDASPWPTNASATGWSVQRQFPNQFGNEPTNWAALWPTAGGANYQDRDRDGMPDDWEIAHGLNPFDASDAEQDLDQDGLSNLQEFIAGTDPTNANSVLKLAIQPGNPLSLRFTAEPGRSYSVQYRDTLTANIWAKLSDIPPPLIETNIEVMEPAAPLGGERFYRLVTPAQP